MPLPSGLPVVDHHCHLSPLGEGLRAVDRFRAAGGTHLFLATQNYEPTTPTALDDYRRQFELTERLAAQAFEHAGVTVYPVLAPYPIDLVRAADSLGLPAALDLHLKALDLAGREVRERRAVALGEVGRPHFPIPPDTAAAIDTAFRHALCVARDSDCPAVVHSADLDADGFRALAREASSVGMPPARVVKHYARSRVDAPEPNGVVPSYLARRELTDRVRRDPAPWFLETDYLDDPLRPGAVLDLATVPRRASTIAQTHPEEADRLWIPFSESVRKVYGFDPVVSAAGRLP